ncbi:M3 family metallopeptidase [Caulobacter segnis]
MGSDPMEVIEAVREEVAVVRPPAWHRFPHAFTHIFAGGYASGYYSYLWAEVLAADGFQRFAEAGLIDRGAAAGFCEEILSGARAVRRRRVSALFRGRDADPAAMLVRHGPIADAR